MADDKINLLFVPYVMINVKSNFEVANLESEVVTSYFFELTYLYLKGALSKMPGNV